MAVACGDAHTVFVSEDGGAVFAGGCGEHGRLGCGDEAPRNRPVRIDTGEAFEGARVVMLAAGSLHSAATTADGALFTWGHGRHGKLGHGDRHGRLQPTRIAPEIFAGRSVVMAACGTGHTLALVDDGTAYSCGHAEFGQLGHGDERALSTMKQLDTERFGGRAIEMLAAGGLHSALVTAGGDVYTFGRGVAGQLGHGDTSRRLVPTILKSSRFGSSAVVVVACGLHYTVAVTAEGVVWSWVCLSVLNGCAFCLRLRRCVCLPRSPARSHLSLLTSQLPLNRTSNARARSLVHKPGDSPGKKRQRPAWPWRQREQDAANSRLEGGGGFRRAARGPRGVRLRSHASFGRRWRRLGLGQRHIWRAGPGRQSRQRDARACVCKALWRVKGDDAGSWGGSRGRPDRGRRLLHLGLRPELRTSVGRTLPRGPVRQACAHAGRI